MQECVAITNLLLEYIIDNSLNKFLKKKSLKHFPSKGPASLCGVVVECDINNGLAKNIESFVFGGSLKNNF